MTAYTYGPWTQHTGDEYPVEADARVQIWCDGDTKEQAEENPKCSAFAYDWTGRMHSPIRFYRVCTPVEDLWQVDTGWVRDNGGFLDFVLGCGGHVSDVLRISWPCAIINGRRVPDFTRQPKWETLK